MDGLGACKLKLYKVFSWDVASLLEDKSWDVHSVQVCAKYRQESSTLSPYHQRRKIKAAPEVGCLIGICKSSIYRDVLREHMISSHVVSSLPLTWLG